MSELEAIIPLTDERGFVTDPEEAGRLGAWRTRHAEIVTEIKDRYAAMIIGAFDVVPLEALRVLAGVLLPTRLGKVIDLLLDDRLVDRDGSENRYARLLLWRVVDGRAGDGLIDRLDGAVHPPWPAVRAALVAARAELAELPDPPCYGVSIGCVR